MAFSTRGSRNSISATTISIIHGRLQIYFAYIVVIILWVIRGSNNSRNSNSRRSNFYNSRLWQKNIYFPNRELIEPRWYVLQSIMRSLICITVAHHTCYASYLLYRVQSFLLHYVIVQHTISIHPSNIHHLSTCDYICSHWTERGQIPLLLVHILQR